MSFVPFAPLAAMPGKFRLAVRRPLSGVARGGRRVALFLRPESAACFCDDRLGRAPRAGAAE